MSVKTPRCPPPWYIWISRWPPLTVRRAVEDALYLGRSHEKIGDCEQSISARYIFTPFSHAEITVLICEQSRYIGYLHDADPVFLRTRFLCLPLYPQLYPTQVRLWMTLPLVTEGLFLTESPVLQLSLSKILFHHRSVKDSKANGQLKRACG